MSPEERELLNKSVMLAEENNKILRSLRRSQRISRIMTIIYWVLIIGSTIGAWYFIQPFIDQATSAYSGARGNFDSINEFLQNLKN
jgi:hypothetical protein